MMGSERRAIGIDHDDDSRPVALLWIHAAHGHHRLLVFHNVRDLGDMSRWLKSDGPLFDDNPRVLAEPNDEKWFNSPEGEHGLLAYVRERYGRSKRVWWHPPIRKAKERSLLRSLTR